MNEILFFYLRTGGGHLAPVRALASEMQTRHPDRVEPVLLDGMKGARGFARFIIEDGYRITQARANWIYEMAYAFAKFPPGTLANSALVSRVLRGGLEQQLFEHRPKAIVIAHFFLIAPLLDLLRKHRLDIPTVTIVTDPYTAHPLWFLRKEQTMVVFSDRVKETAVRLGLPADRVHVFPFILNPHFSPENVALRVAQTRAALGFPPDQKVVLLLGGGDGMPRGYRITRKIMGEFPEAGVVLVCGKNKNLFRMASRLVTRAEGKNLRVFAYVDNVPDLIGVSDAVLTKGGASTLMEILALGKTPVVTTYIWEQEKGNVEFVVKEHRGVYEKRIGKLPEILGGIFNDSPPFRLIRETNQRSPIRSGTREVSDFIMKQGGLL
jgi:processive 1,2-diacylglycerol beta-glucosyltransferase/1,2-diacylglycerol 3-beta-galactosyltransferase